MSPALKVRVGLLSLLRTELYVQTSKLQTTVLGVTPGILLAHSDLVLLVVGISCLLVWCDNAP